MTRHMFPFLIGAMTFKFPDHDDILTALHQLEVNLPCMEIFYPPDAFECNLMAVEGTASFLVVKRPLDKGMSWMKTNVKLVMDESDNTIADLMTDGCNMGVKSLSRYLNQYATPDEVSKDIAKRLIKPEEQLATDMRQFL